MGELTWILVLSLPSSISEDHVYCVFTRMVCLSVDFWFFLSFVFVGTDHVTEKRRGKSPDCEDLQGSINSKLFEERFGKKDLLVRSSSEAHSQKKKEKKKWKLNREQTGIYRSTRNGASFCLIITRSQKKKNKLICRAKNKKCSNCRKSYLYLILRHLDDSAHFCTIII